MSGKVRRLVRSSKMNYVILMTIHFTNKCTEFHQIKLPTKHVVHKRKKFPFFLHHGVDRMTMTSVAKYYLCLVLPPPFCGYTFCNESVIKQLESAMPAYCCASNYKNNPITYAVDKQVIYNRS